MGSNPIQAIFWEQVSGNTRLRRCMSSYSLPHFSMLLTAIAMLIAFLLVAYISTTMWFEDTLLINPNSVQNMDKLIRIKPKGHLNALIPSEWLKGYMEFLLDCRMAFGQYEMNHSQSFFSFALLCTNHIKEKLSSKCNKKSYLKVEQMERVSNTPFAWCAIWPRINPGQIFQIQHYISIHTLTYIRHITATCMHTTVNPVIIQHSFSNMESGDVLHPLFEN